jgi:hypothetical protein
MTLLQLGRNTIWRNETLTVRTRLYFRMRSLAESGCWRRDVSFLVACISAILTIGPRDFCEISYLEFLQRFFVAF